MAKIAAAETGGAEAASLLDALGGRARIADELRAFQSDLEWLAQTRETLLRQHPGQWIAVYNSCVVAVAESQGELAALVRGKGVPPGRTVFEHLVDVIVVA